MHEAPPGGTTVFSMTGGDPPRLLALAVVALFLVNLPGPVPSQGRREKKEPAPPAWRKPLEVPSTEGVHCRTCNGKGWRWCRRHRRSFLELEAPLRLSSAASSCPECGGMLRVDCPSCRNPAAEAWLEAFRKRRLAWLKEKRIYDKVVKHELLHLASPHYEMIFDIPKLKVGRQVLGRHRLAHLYLDRLEAFYEKFKRVMHCRDHEFKPPFQVCLWDRAKEQNLVGARITGMGSRGGHGTKLMGIRVAFTVARGRGVRTDEDLHRCVVHNVAHLLLSNIEPHQWIGKLRAGWLDAGVAHYFEFLHDGLCTNFCFTEQNTEIDFKGGKWRAWLRKEVAQGGDDLPRFVAYYNKLIDELSPLEHAMAFSNVEFLMTEYGGRKMKRMVREIMRKKPQRKVIEDVYGFSVLEFEEKWRIHVLKTYPTRE